VAPRAKARSSSQRGDRSRSRSGRDKRRSAAAQQAAADEQQQQQQQQQQLAEEQEQRTEEGEATPEANAEQLQAAEGLEAAVEGGGGASPEAAGQGPQLEAPKGSTERRRSDKRRRSGGGGSRSGKRRRDGRDRRRAARKAGEVEKQEEGPEGQQEEAQGEEEVQRWEEQGGVGPDGAIPSVLRELAAADDSDQVHAALGPAGTGGPLVHGSLPSYGSPGAAEGGEEEGGAEGEDVLDTEMASASRPGFSGGAPVPAPLLGPTGTEVLTPSGADVLSPSVVGGGDGGPGSAPSSSRGAGLGGMFQSMFTHTLGKITGGFPTSFLSVSPQLAPVPEGRQLGGGGGGSGGVNSPQGFPQPPGAAPAAGGAAAGGAAVAACGGAGAEAAARRRRSRGLVEAIEEPAGAPQLGPGGLVYSAPGPDCQGIVCTDAPPSGGGLAAGSDPASPHAGMAPGSARRPRSGGRRAHGAPFAQQAMGPW
jgi:hypothetical protein